MRIVLIESIDVDLHYQHPDHAAREQDAQHHDSEAHRTQQFQHLVEHGIALLGVTCTTGTAAGGASVVEDNSVSVVAILGFPG